MATGNTQAAAGDKKHLAILVGGGPAPGINGVIRSATIEALDAGIPVLGIRDGFKWLAKGDSSAVIPLTYENVSRIHTAGGSILGTSREAPAKSEAKMNNVLETLRKLNVGYLVTIGGDDTASSASRVDALTANEIAVAHVPKTIDNDLPLPFDLPTFGFQTARQVATDLVVNLIEDARTTGRWYFVIAMGRSAGHLALGIAKASGSNLAIIPEEFRGQRVPLRDISAILEGAILRQLRDGINHGVAVVAEGAAECVNPDDFTNLKDVERDEHGHVRLAELPFGTLLKQSVQKQLAKYNHKVTLVEKNIGYELRCAAPIASNLEYTWDLGSAAVRALRSGNGGILTCLRGAELIPMKLKDMLDPKTGKMQVRRVDVDSSGYGHARRYMRRLGPAEFEGARFAGLLEQSGLTKEQFLERYGNQAKPW